MAALLCLVIASGAVAALTPLALTQIVDALGAALRTPGPHEAWPWTQGAAYLLLLCAVRVAADLRPLLSGDIDQRIQAGLTRRFFDHLMRLPMTYLLRRRSGELLHCLDLASTGSQLMLAHAVNSLIPVIAEIATMTLILLKLEQPALVGLFGLTALVYLAVFARGTPRLGRQAHGVSTASLEVYAQLNDGIAHAETLRIFAAEPQARARLEAATDALRASWLSLNRLTCGISLRASAVFAASMAACLTVAAGAVMHGSLTVGGFVLVTVYMLQIVRPLELLGTAARDVSRSMGFLRPLLELLSEPVEAAEGGTMPAAPHPTPRPAHAPAVRLENVHFGYDAERPVIRGLDLDVPAGRTTAIVGRSGSGKSSLAKLLLRLHAPQAGRILLDGRPIETIPAAQLRAWTGLVPQETALLHASIASNIALGLPAARREDIELAARGAQLHLRVADMPRGYDALVGERGLQLSGGERQRVAIARALLRRPALFILDEPTSMLDSKTEADIQQALRKLTDGSTTIVIAHRLSTIMHADQIAVLDDGRIVESGRHAELIAREGLYAQLWRQQMQGAPGQRYA